MEKHYYLREYSKRCKVEGCKEPPTQQICSMQTHESMGEFCYDHAQAAIAKLEEGRRAYQQALHSVLNLEHKIFGRSSSGE